MRRNRKIPKKMSVVATNTMRFFAIIVVFFVMVILNLLSASSCTQLQNAKGALEREIAKLDDARMRESTRWEEMKTPEKVEAALLRHGLLMRTPGPAQTVVLMADGTPRPGQLSLAKMKMRSGVASVASASRSAPSAYRSASRRRARSTR